MVLIRNLILRVYELIQNWVSTCEEWIFENKSLNEKKKRKKKVDDRVVILSKIKYYFVKIKNNNTHPMIPIQG